MTAKDVIFSNYAMSEGIVGLYLGDLSDEDLLVRPVAGQNHIAWQLGHLLLSEKGMLDAIRPGTSPPLPAGFEETHGRDEAATASDDTGKFLKKDGYLALMKAQRDATKSLVESMTEAELDAPAPERFRKMFPTTGGVLALIGLHVMMHVGQFVSVRRALKKPVAM